MDPTTQLIITTVSTIIASGAIWRLFTTRSDIANIRALARKTEEETKSLELKRTLEVAEYYYGLWKRCEERKQGDGSPPPTIPPQIT